MRNRWHAACARQRRLAYGSSPYPPTSKPDSASTERPPLGSPWRLMSSNSPVMAPIPWGREEPRERLPSPPLPDQLHSPGEVARDPSAASRPVLPTLARLHSASKKMKHDRRAIPAI